MRSLLTLAVGAGVLVLIAGSAQAARTRSRNPSFKVTVVSTYTRHHITHLATKPQSNGCVVHTDSDATQLITTKLLQPVVLTYRQIRHGVHPTILSARETRGGSYYYGYQQGCPNYNSQPPAIGATSGCRKQASFKVLTDHVSVGFIGGTSRFRFSYQYAGPDAFNGTCVPEVFVGESDQIPNAEIVDVPLDVWVSGANAQPWWTSVNPKRLLAGKPVVVKFKRSGTITDPRPTGDPSAYDVAVISDAYSVSWTVTLTPVTP